MDVFIGTGYMSSVKS